MFWAKPISAGKGQIKENQVFLNVTFEILSKAYDQKYSADRTVFDFDEDYDLSDVHIEEDDESYRRRRAPEIREVGDGSEEERMGDGRDVASCKLSGTH